MPKSSETASSILAILNNINDLIVKSSDRQNAKEVMKALKIYGENKNFPLPQDKINNFYAVLLDAKPFTLTSIIKDIASDIIEADRKR